jgi:hypothetical protein
MRVMVGAVGCLSCERAKAKRAGGLSVRVSVSVREDSFGGWWLGVMEEIAGLVVVVLVMMEMKMEMEMEMEMEMLVRCKFKMEERAWRNSIGWKGGVVT